MISIKHFLILITIFSFISCVNKVQVTKETTSLKNTFKESFFIGTALNANHINENDTIASSLINNEFNSITSENIMKSMFIHPAKDTFYFKMSDKFVTYGQNNNMHIVGHTLIWHSQLSPWIAKIKDSVEMVQFMENHINTIVTRYNGKINNWDVVNEALNDDGTLRKSVFLDVLGEDYLTLAFKLASQADPEADLYYNDYSMTNPAKRKGAIELVKKIQKNGVKIDGIGMQGHWRLHQPSIKQIEESILDYAELGLKVAITELDISVLQNPWDLQGADVDQNFEGSELMNPYPISLPDSIQTKLTQRYSDIFKLFLKHQDKISRVTFWGVTDGLSWLNDWPIKGRTNYPLLFDTEFKPKKAYYSVMELKEDNNKTK